MSAKIYKCSLAGDKVQVIVEKLVYYDESNKINRPSLELRKCSHIANGECPVRIENENNRQDVQGWGYSQTQKCEYLQVARSNKI